MQSIKSKALILPCLLALGATLSVSGCATQANITIPDSLREPCVPTADVSQATTVADLAKAIIQGDADTRVCSIKKDAVVAIAESQNRRWWWPF